MQQRRASNPGDDLDAAFERHRNGAQNEQPSVQWVPVATFRVTPNSIFSVRPTVEQIDFLNRMNKLGGQRLFISLIAMLGAEMFFEGIRFKNPIVGGIGSALVLTAVMINQIITPDLSEHRYGMRIRPN